MYEVFRSAWYKEFYLVGHEVWQSYTQNYAKLLYVYFQSSHTYLTQVIIWENLSHYQSYYSNS